MRATHGIVAALSASFPLASAAACSKPSFLYVSSYSTETETGGVTTFKLGSKGLEQVGALSSTICGPYPSWQTLVGDDQYYCVDEAWNSQIQGGFYSAKVNPDGSLAPLSSIPTAPGPVNIAIYGEGNRGAAIANFGNGSIETFNLANPAQLQAIHKDQFPNPLGNRTARQLTARPHQAVLDPTGDFIVFPDLGSDLLRVFKVDKTTLELTARAAHELDEMTGPRHAAFFKSDSKTFLYVVNELQNSLTGFSVAYSGDDLTFTQIYNDTTHGDGTPVVGGAHAGEILISPDNKFLTVSSRDELTENFTLANGTTVPSDLLITYSINAETGQLTHVQTAPSGGHHPRHFTFNKAGNRVAVVSQIDGRVVVFERDVATGKIGKSLAEATFTTGPNHILWKE